MTVVLMGPAGAGKTTVGQLLAHDLRWPFLDADSLHSPENVARMHRGEALSDADRLGHFDDRTLKIVLFFGES